MADVNRGIRSQDRPLSPHLQIYRPQLTAITSILTRITGNGLIVAALLLVWWLLAAASGPEYFAFVDGIVRSWFGKLIFLGSIWAVWFHFCAGLRHLWFDSGRGLDIPTAEKLGWAVIGGSVLLTVITVAVL
jgi:succinate dehydrogenase / fumarate reductase, cytochrome b subunit